jgi:Ca2+-binding RTX toxin-like protein
LTAGRASSSYAKATITIAALAAAVAFATSTESSSAARPECFGKRATIVGGQNGNTLRGTEHADVIVGGGGNDKIDGRGGRDVICGGEGKDKIFGGPDFDSLSGGARGDRMFGEGDKDQINGDEGADLIFGGQRTDVLDGGDGPDELNGGPATDLIFGGSSPVAPDELFGGPGDDILAGELGDDNLFGGTGNDDLSGGTGEGTDNCQQEAGTGPVADCEADLAVDVVGAASSPEGNIPFRVTVTNNGPSSVPYTLALDEDDHHMFCGSPSFEGTHPETDLAAGFARTQDLIVTCAKEGDPGRQVSLDATLSGPPDPAPGNNHDIAITVITE